MNTILKFGIATELKTTRKLQSSDNGLRKAGMRVFVCVCVCVYVCVCEYVVVYTSLFLVWFLSNTTFIPHERVLESVKPVWHGALLVNTGDREL